MTTPIHPLAFHRLRGLLVPIVADLHGGLNTVGRNPTNDVVIHEASVSSFHAEVTIDENGVRVRDLQSTNGTFVDDEPIDEAGIRPGQVVQFGTVAFRLEAEEQTAAGAGPTRAPAATKAPEAISRPLPAGTLACSVDASIPATHRCTKCGRVFHHDKLRVLRLSGGAATLLFCPSCSARVEAIPGIDPAKVGRPNLLARLTQTIRLGFHRPK
ncbi:MAG: FHA domain-containing protein [Verrucomicrobia bacterium]|nr:MAG: FHA domain-containing protein [Verrucomicrobiota bacterium]